MITLREACDIYIGTVGIKPSKVVEYPKFYVFNKNDSLKTKTTFMDGLFSVNKKTGKIEPFSPITSGLKPEEYRSGKVIPIN